MMCGDIITHVHLFFSCPSIEFSCDVGITEKIKDGLACWARWPEYPHRFATSTGSRQDGSMAHLLVSISLFPKKYEILLFLFWYLNKHVCSWNNQRREKLSCFFFWQKILSIIVGDYYLSLHSNISIIEGDYYLILHSLTLISFLTNR